MRGQIIHNCIALVIGNGGAPANHFADFLRPIICGPTPGSDSSDAVAGLALLQNNFFPWAVRQEACVCAGWTGFGLVCLAGREEQRQRYESRCCDQFESCVSEMEPPLHVLKRSPVKDC